jgi:hypothetical protein
VLATSGGREVSLMEIYVNERPSVMPAVLVPMSARQEILPAGMPLRPWEHQAQVQQAQVRAELALGSAVGNGTGGFTGNGTNGATSKDIPTSKKRMDIRGVPPRGRPV